KEHVKPRLLGHWGTTPGLNFIYAHLNRAIKQRDLNMIYIIGPGHGGPGIVANAYMEGTYSEVYPNIAQDEEGMKRLFTQFSFPGGIPSHVAPETPGSIHEGGELGYSVSHAYGAAYDNPDLIVACVVGDGEAESGALATSWHSNKFLDPVTDGRRTEGYWRSHQGPMGEMHENPAHVRILEDWMKSYQPGELFDGNGRLRPELAELPPRGNRRMSANPHTNGGLVLRDLKLPNFRDYAVEVTAPGATNAESTREMGKFLRDIMKMNMDSRNFRLFSPDEK